VSGWVSDWFVAFVTTLLLSIACVGALIVPWHDIEPELSEGETTRAGRTLLRARLLFTAACGLVFACTGVLYYFGFEAPDNSQSYRWFREHPASVPMLLMFSAGLSGVSFFLTQMGKGDARRSLMIATLVIALLSFGGSLCLFSSSN
jgi:hypothetical protein